MSDHEIQSTRLIPHSRAKLFRAYSEPALLTQWFGPKGFTSTFYEFDFRNGGHWRFTFHGPDGTNYENEWVFLEIIEGERIDLDHVCAPYFTMFTTLTEEAGMTRITWRMVFQSAEVLAGIKHVIVPANEENFDRLEVVLESI